MAENEKIRPILAQILIFQAEDGIRDKLVTGVQTCALPIFSLTISLLLPFPISLVSIIGVFILLNLYMRRRMMQRMRMRGGVRSEERRVGKECRYRWFRYLSKSTNDSVKN